MNHLQPIRFYLILLGFFLAALVGGTLYFLVGMHETTYLVTDGARVGMEYLNKPRYDENLQGFIFSLSFLIAGLLMVLVIILPDRPGASQAQVRTAPPQPRRRTGPTPPAQAAQAAPAEAAAQPAQRTAAQPPPAAEAAAPKAESPKSTIEWAESERAEEAPAPAPTPAEPAAPATSVEDEVLKSKADDLPEIDLPDSRFEDTGEDDVVYGTGRVSEDAAWEFVQSYPDSAVKFLYRKTLDNKTLSPTEEDIYRKWEMRGLTRAKVREIVLEIMSWQSLPEDFPHNIWRELRDQIFEMKSR